jgi:hypothetical protein
MVERGVRFVTIYHEGWDAHSNVAATTAELQEDRPGSAALVKDLKARGMLDETLVVWGGEFGRTPMVESNPSLNRSQGRDHHPQAFTMWMAGGGVRRAAHGQTDDLGFHVADKPVHVHDLQATSCTARLDHERLTYKSQGRDFRLTDVHGHVVNDILVDTPRDPQRDAPTAGVPRRQTIVHEGHARVTKKRDRGRLAKLSPSCPLVPFVATTF